MLVYHQVSSDHPVVHVGHKTVDNHLDVGRPLAALERLLYLLVLAADNYHLILALKAPQLLADVLCNRTDTVSC